MYQAPALEVIGSVNDLTLTLIKGSLGDRESDN